MAIGVLRLIEDRLEAGTQVSLPATNRVIYVVDGQADVRSGELTERINPNEAWHWSGEMNISGGRGGAKVWRWELVDAPESNNGQASGTGVESRVKLSAEIEVDGDGEYLMRCDRVDFPLGGIAYTHTHQGSGIRCLYTGEFDVTVAGETKHLNPGVPWFEAGPDPVYAEASKTELTAFIRVMILPRRLQGQSSIRYVNEEDADKPKTQTYTMLVDEPIEVSSKNPVPRSLASSLDGEVELT